MEFYKNYEINKLDMFEKDILINKAKECTKLKNGFNIIVCYAIDLISKHIDNVLIYEDINKSNDITNSYLKYNKNALKICLIYYVILYTIGTFAYEYYKDSILNDSSVLKIDFDINKTGDYLSNLYKDIYVNFRESVKKQKNLMNIITPTFGLVSFFERNLILHTQYYAIKILINKIKTIKTVDKTIYDTMTTGEREVIDVFNELYKETNIKLVDPFNYEKLLFDLNGIINQYNHLLKLNKDEVDSLEKLLGTKEVKSINVLKSLYHFKKMLNNDNVRKLLEYLFFDNDNKNIGLNLRNNINHCNVTYYDCFDYRISFILLFLNQYFQKLAIDEINKLK